MKAVRKGPVKTGGVKKPYRYKPGSKLYIARRQLNIANDI
jgi:hypothetical protein